MAGHISPKHALRMGLDIRGQRQTQKDFSDKASTSCPSAGVSESVSASIILFAGPLGETWLS